MSARLIMFGLEAPEKKVKMNRKKLYVAVVLIFVVLIFVVLAGIMIYLIGSSTQTIKIVRFFLVDQPSHLTVPVHVEGDEVVFPFYVKIENSGANNASNLVLVVKVFGDHSELGRDTADIHALEAGRRITMSMVVRVNTSELQGKSISYGATLYQGNTVVDEAIGEI